MMTHFTKTSQVFKHCHTLVANYNVDFICHAIFRAEFGDEWSAKWLELRLDDTPVLSGKFLTAYNHIHELLGNHCTLDSWLEHNIGDYSFIDKQTRFQKVRETRLAWLESLIAEFEAKGD